MSGGVFCPDTDVARLPTLQLLFFNKQMVIFSHHSMSVVDMSCLRTKPTEWHVRQRRLRSVWASAQSDQSLCCPHEESLGP